jgi:RNA recognition motif-containing protein
MKLYVGNLSKEITDAQLTDLAVKFGGLKSSTVARERTSGDSKGFGFVEFNNKEEAQAAIVGLNGTEFGGRTLKVSEARSQAAKDPLGGKY